MKPNEVFLVVVSVSEAQVVEAQAEPIIVDVGVQPENVEVNATNIPLRRLLPQLSWRVSRILRLRHQIHKKPQIQNIQTLNVDEQVEIEWIIQSHKFKQNFIYL